MSESKAMGMSRAERLEALIARTQLMAPRRRRIAIVADFVESGIMRKDEVALVEPPNRDDVARELARRRNVRRHRSVAS